MKDQEISVLLETASFFFVGIDLYGQDRLKKMQENFLRVSEKVNNQVTRIQEFDWSKNRRGKFMKTVYLFTGAIQLTMLIIVLIKSDLKISPENLKDWAFWLQVLAIIVLVGTFILLIILLSLVFILIALIVMMATINGIIRGAMWAFRFYQIEGVFLFVGTMLFLISKYYQLY